MLELEDQEDQIEVHMEEKARLIKQKNELTNLMRTVENNVEPRRFKTSMGNPTVHSTSTTASNTN